MIESAEKLEAHLQRLVEVGVAGIDIMHGQLKIEMLEAEKLYSDAVQVEEDNDYSDAMESMDRKYAEGFMDAMSYIYKMTYDISFALSAKEAGE
jgi:hypothetical protein